VLYPDGSLPPESQALLSDLKEWMSTNADAIHGTRPWGIYGEGPTQIAAGAFKESAEYTAADIRFTTKAGAINALFLEWPDGEAAIASLGTNAMPEAMIERVEAIGGGPLEARRDADALRFRLPRPEGDSFVPTVRISGSGLV